MKRQTSADAEIARLLFGNPELSIREEPQRPMPVAAQEALQRLNRVAYRFELPLPPSVNEMYVPMGKGRLVLSKSARQYKAGAGLVAQANGFAPFKGDVSVQVDIYRAHGDLDNFAKCLLDTLKGICYRDDRQVKRLVMDIHDEKEPQLWRAEIEIREVQA